MFLDRCVELFLAGGWCTCTSSGMFQSTEGGQQPRRDQRKYASILYNLEVSYNPVFSAAVLFFCVEFHFLACMVSEFFIFYGFRTKLILLLFSQRVHTAI